MTDLSQHEAKSLLLELLQKVDEQGPTKEHLGICYAIESLGAPEGSLILFMNMCADWPEYSGSIVFPVPHPTMEPIKAFSLIADVWDPRTEYGQARWRLLHWCIDTLKGELNA